MLQKPFNALASYARANPGKAGTVAGWFQQACSAGIAILLVPILLRLLGTQNAGVWFSFQGFVNIANLADFGFGFAISRQVAFSLGQDKSHTVSGDFLNYGRGPEGVRRVMAHAGHLYRRITLVSVGVCILIFEVLLPMTKLGPATAEYRLLWYLMAASTLLMLNVSRFNSLLIGLNQVYIVRGLTGLYFLMQGLGVAAVAYATGSLTLMALASFTATSVNWMAVRIITGKFTGRIPSIRTAFPEPGTRPSLVRIAAPMGLVNTSAFLVNSIQVPVIGAFLGPASVTPFYLAQKIGQFLNMGAMQVIQPRLPAFTALIAKYQNISARILMINILKLTAILTVLANISFYFLGSRIATLLSGSDLYPNNFVTGLLAVDYLFVGLATVWGQFVLASGRNPFVISTIFNGLLNIILLIFLIPAFGIAGVPLSALISGILTNYWFNPYCGIKTLTSLRS